MSLTHKTCLGTVAYLGGVPAVLEQFAWSWGQMVQYNAEMVPEGTFIHYDRAQVSVHDVARNDLVSRMLGDFIVMLDADHAFEPDLIVRMAKLAARQNLQVLTALYQYKRPPFAPVLYGKTASGVGRVQLIDWSKNMDLFPIDSSGAGSLFVRRDVFERIGAELKELPFARTGKLGEDHSFFERLKKLNISAWCAPDIQTFHLRVQPTKLEEYSPVGYWGVANAVVGRAVTDRPLI